MSATCPLPFRCADAVREVHRLVNKGHFTPRAKYLSPCHLSAFGPNLIHCNQPFGRCIRFAPLGVPMLARPITEKDGEASYELIDNEL